METCFNHRGQLGHLHSELVDPFWPLHANISVLIKLFLLKRSKQSRANKYEIIRNTYNHVLSCQRKTDTCGRLGGALKRNKKILLLTFKALK